MALHKPRINNLKDLGWEKLIQERQNKFIYRKVYI